jgi:hypothetical protein
MPMIQFYVTNNQFVDWLKLDEDNKNNLKKKFINILEKETPL